MMSVSYRNKIARKNKATPLQLAVLDREYKSQLQLFKSTSKKLLNIGDKDADMETIINGILMLSSEINTLSMNTHLQYTDVKKLKTFIENKGLAA